ncbi:NAD(P)-dependent oxidoreductase [Trinickia caryophylli]|nr:NAD(P)-dependent oxidoreductase [Trinickia caryophylli]WQE12986.1 NAD(P)-dependent oxidoreductase [Trinickia caryophylli]
MATDTDFDYVVAGATGWLGRATLDHLRRRLPDGGEGRIHAFASSAREVMLADGATVAVDALDSLPARKLSRPAIVFHYAFRTKDRVGDMSVDEYVRSNEGIRRALVEFIDTHAMAGMFVPSSGAAYAGLERDNRSDAAIYGRCKLDDERVFAGKAAQNGFRAVIARVFNLSGPYINKHELYALSSIILACLRNEPVRIQASHPVWRSYYAVEDLISLAIASMTDETIGIESIIDTVGTEVIEVGELAQRCRHVLGAAQVSVERPYVKAEPNNYYVGAPAGIRTLEARCNIAPRSLDRQILDTAAYLRSFAGKSTGE